MGCQFLVNVKMTLNHILYIIRGGNLPGQGRGLGMPPGQQAGHGGGVPHADVPFRQKGVQLFLDAAVGVSGYGFSQGEGFQG